MEEYREHHHKIPQFASFGLATAAYGAIKGFCDALEINTTNYLFLAPPVVHGIMGILDGVSIAKTGEQSTGNYPEFMIEDFSKSLDGSEEFLNRGFVGGFTGFIAEGIAGSLEMMAGYGAGYLAGKYAKYKSLL